MRSERLVKMTQIFLNGCSTGGFLVVDDIGTVAAPKGIVHEYVTFPNAVPPDAAFASHTLGRSDGFLCIDHFVR